jgi:hypothetical protein
MSATTLARKREAPSATAKAAPQSAAELRISEPDDAFEREADRIAPHFDAMLQWSLARMTIGAALQRKCSGVDSCNCDGCRSRKRPTGRNLKLSQPGDPFELEADRIAELVVGSDAKQQVSSASGRLQRQADDASSDEPEPDLANEQLEPDETGRPKREGGAAGPTLVSWQPPPSQGRPLPAASRMLMEQRLGHDFGHVRIHDDGAANRSAASLHAHAYTVGADIYFNAGMFRSDSPDGTKLLAHELVHVVQQSDTGTPPTVQRQRKKPVRAAGCDGNCSPTTGPVHSPVVGNETCSNGSAASSTNFIRHLDVNLKSQMVEAEIGDAKHATGLVGPFLSSPNPHVTPTGLHRIGIKCTACHTNQHGAGMGWFTSFANGLEFGFHDSQRVATGTHSHGCVRVPCDRAHWIHDNTSSSVTTVCVHSGGTEWGCDHARPQIGGSSALGETSGLTAMESALGTAAPPAPTGAATQGGAV